MSLIIQYCEGCGERIPSDALENGEALLFQDSYFFGPCKAKILADHPELVNQAPQPRSQAGGYRASGIFETPIAPDTRRHAKSSSVRMQRKSGTAATAPTSSPAAARRPETSRRAPKSGGGGAGDQKLVFGAVAAVILVAAIALVAMSGSSGGGPGGVGPGGVGPGSAGPGSDPTQPLGPGSTTKPPPTPVRDEQAEKLAAYEKKANAATAKNYQELIEEGADLERLFAGGAHLTRLREIKGELERKLRELSAHAFDALKKEVDTLVASGKFDEAITRWDGFDASLMSDEVRKKIFDEKDKVEDARRRAGPPHQDKIPTDGEQIDLLGGDVRWYTASGGAPWTQGDGEYASPAESPQRSLTYACKGTATSFGDFYLSFEYQLAAGQLTLIVRATDNNTEGAPNTLNLPVTPGGWKRVHVVARGDVVQTWFDGDKDSFVQSKATVMVGAIAFACGPNSPSKLRLIEARVQAFGRDLTINQPPPTPAADLPPLPVAVPGKQRPLFAGANLGGWTVPNGADWPILGGVLMGKANGNSTWIRTGDVTWTGYTIRFEYRKVVGQLVVCYNWRDGEPQRFQIPASPPGNEDWMQCVVVVKGTEITAYPAKDGKVVGNPLHTKYEQASGRFGLMLNGSSSAEIRSITYESHD